MIRVFREEGINWDWFTILDLREDGTVFILLHNRLHKDRHVRPEYLKQAELNRHCWKEKEPGRIAIAYSIPGMGWCKIENQRYIFSYEIHKPTSGHHPGFPDNLEDI